MTKMTVEQIRARFDNDVERFSDISKGHQAAVDSVVALDLISTAALAVTPDAVSLLDVGCGAGNWSVKFLSRKPGLEVTLLDLAPAMLERAQERALQAGASHVTLVESDIRDAQFDSGFDVIVASAVLHHLRDEHEWMGVFGKFYGLLNPGGSLWIYDLVDHELPEVAHLMKEHHGRHLESIGGPSFRDEIFGNIDREDTPRPLSFQLDLLRKAGFKRVDVLHKNSRFAAFGALKEPSRRIS
jgi:tRNA (cmo5U34)-methyltransferase